MYEDGGMDGPWQPLTIEQVRSRFAGIPVPWWIAGGHAIDLFVGWQTRDHADIDVEMFRADREVLFAAFQGWELFTVGHGGLVRWEPGAVLAPHVFGVWGRPSAGEPWAVEVMLADGDPGMWRFRRDPEIGLAGDRLVRRDRADVPYCTPEVQLLYKSRMARPKDDLDIARVLPLMTRTQRTWLAEAIARGDHGHPWIDLLEMANASHRE
jgi:hypothetical protein